MINIHLGQIVRGITEDSKRPDHINIQIPYHIFRETVVGEQIRREAFLGWINKEVYPALNDVPEKKMTIELTR